LEENLKNFSGAKHAIGCASGTDALTLALMAIDIQPGDEVITTPFTFYATAEMIAFLKATPVFVDINEDDYNINPDLIEAKITDKTKAIIGVSLYGQMADYDRINEIAAKHNLVVIEDGAQSFGAKIGERRSCSVTKLATTSFFPAKPLGCYGDGGAVFTDDDALAEKIRSILNHGQGERYVHKYIGFNGRLDAIQAGVLNVKLKYFDDEISKRQEVAKNYDEGLNGTVVIPTVRENRLSVYAQYSIRVKDRADVQKKLGDAGVPAAIHYPIPLYRQEAFKYLNIDSSDYPVSEKIASEIMSLPMSPWLSKEDQEKVVAEVIKAIK
ncbi:MAG: DegT/DnrJ/EryC1/StrS family aminotransferase, partial [Campylobacterales bacterium]|nr:DegT/DnrJ/EryC1/StrS family aminotransferase [Campylobacterales bacterium]